MNIFYLDENPALAAKYHCDKHVVKMILETAQMLSTSVHLTGGEPGFKIYKPTHKNHPSAIWARSSIEHYRWLCKLGLFLCVQYTIRYGKVHKTQSILENLYSYKPDIPSIGFFDPPQAMPDQFKQENTVAAYRNYYRKGKAHLVTYKTKYPEWFID